MRRNADSGRTEPRFRPELSGPPVATLLNQTSSACALVPSSAHQSFPKIDGFALALDLRAASCPPAYGAVPSRARMARSATSLLWFQGSTVLRVKAPHRYVAWLAMLAMTFIVVMPVISRMMPMTGAMPGMDGSCPEHAALAAKQPGSPHTPVDPMERCGYCFLLHHSPLLSSSVVVHLVPAAPEPDVPVEALPVDRSNAPLLSADPRGPPAHFS
jgi:hypothetical protein